MSSHLRRVLRNYHYLTPTRFHLFNNGVRAGITGNPKIPTTIWAGHPDLMPAYLAASEKYDAIFPDAGFGHRVAIAERDVLQSQIVVYLDQIASILEAAAVGNPDMLLSSGFDLAKERRRSSRAKGVPTPSEVDSANNAEQKGNQGI